MSFTTGYYTDECTVYYECNIEDIPTSDNSFLKPDIGIFNDKPYGFKTSFLGFYYIYSGELTISHCGEFITLPEKTLFVCSPDYPIRHIKSKINTEFISANFHSLLVSTFKKSDDLFKIFYADDIEKRIYTPQMHQDNIIISLMDSLKSVILQHYNEPFVLSRILTTITELNTIYDRCFGGNEKEIPNVAIRVIDYIDRHYAENLSIEMLCEKFGVSASSIHRICKKATGKTFKDLIAQLRLREARALIIKKNYLPASAAKICGYKIYSSFYRAYVKAFGISPFNDVKSKQKWPLQ